MNAFEESGYGEQPSQKRPRRKRYSGTHPKSYQQKYKEHDVEAYPEMKAHLLAKGKTPDGTHIPVLVEEVLACLKPDGNLGTGYNGTKLRELWPEEQLVYQPNQRNFQSSGVWLSL